MPPKLLAVGRVDVGQKVVPVFDVGLLVRLAKPFIPLAGGMEGGLLTFPDHSHTRTPIAQPHQGGKWVRREGCGERPQGEGGISACSTDDVPSVAPPGCFSSPHVIPPDVALVRFPVPDPVPLRYFFKESGLDQRQFAIVDALGKTRCPVPKPQCFAGRTIDWP